MAHARPFWTSTLQDLFNGIKNTSMQGDLIPAITLWVFGSPKRLPSPIFGSVSGDLTLPSKWGCDSEVGTRNWIYLEFSFVASRFMWVGCCWQCWSGCEKMVVENGAQLCCTIHAVCLVVCSHIHHIPLFSQSMFLPSFEWYSKPKRSYVNCDKCFLALDVSCG
jgi:hypothetical protein